MHMINIKCVDTYRGTSNTLLPIQQVGTASKLLRSADCYQQRFIKFDGVGIFHSYAELLHAALLESNPAVTSFTPQPFFLRIGRRRYIPDCYYVLDGKRYVVELKPRGEFADEMKLPLEAFFDYENIKFKVISNDSVLEHELIAQNWLRIIRVLINARHEDTQVEEIRLWESFLITPKAYLDDIISFSNRFSSRSREIALFRLIHKGKLTINFNDRDIGINTEVSLCN